MPTRVVRWPGRGPEGSDPTTRPVEKRDPRPCCDPMPLARSLSPATVLRPSCAAGALRTMADLHRMCHQLRVSTTSRIAARRRPTPRAPSENGALAACMQHHHSGLAAPPPPRARRPSSGVSTLRPLPRLASSHVDLRSRGSGFGAAASEQASSRLASPALPPVTTCDGSCRRVTRASPSHTSPQPTHSSRHAVTTVNGARQAATVSSFTRLPSTSHLESSASALPVCWAPTDEARI